MRREQLHEVVSVWPSEDWFRQCADATNHQEEGILEQLLCHDLRDVVEESEGGSAMSAMLRQAVAASSQQNNVKLPDTFRLLVQVETFADMAVNAEKRLDGSTRQCLKLAFTDGYESYHAMEVTRIPELTLMPGLKVLLRGSMSIRHGICGWTPTNAIVLGGSVPELIEFHQNNLQKERQRVGHGVDPTVKALIWMNNQDAEQNVQDESDRASGDVADDLARGSPIANTPSVPPQHQPLTDVPARQQPLTNNPTRSHPSAHPNVSIQHHAQQTNLPSYHQAPPVTRHQQQPNNSARNPYANRPPTTAVVPLPPPANPPQSNVFPIPQSVSPRVANPYQRPALASQASTDSSLSADSPRRPMATATPVEFLQLRELLQRSLTDPTSLPPEATYLVSMCQVGLKLNFNIERRHIGGTKIYEYIMDAKFGCDSDPEKLITCRVSNEILQAFFSLPAAEMRKLSKSDKARSAVLIRDGGIAVNMQMRRVSRYAVMASATKVNASVVDGIVPILNILRAV